MAGTHTREVQEPPDPCVVPPFRDSVMPLPSTIEVRVLPFFLMYLWRARKYSRASLALNV